MVSVIIPALNEAACLAGTLAALAANDAAHEAILVDGGSTDATREFAAAAGIRVLNAQRAGRAAQMNEGAAAATGNALLFLHADTLLPPNGLAAVEAALARPGCVGGGFTRSFDSPSRLLALSCYGARTRVRLTSWFYGDQAIFVARAAFERVGGYRDLPVFEDVDLCRRLKREGRLALLPERILSSARRFPHGRVLATIWRDAWLTLRYACGASPASLARALKRNRPKR